MPKTSRFERVGEQKAIVLKTMFFYFYCSLFVFESFDVVKTTRGRTDGIYGLDFPSRKPELWLLLSIDFVQLYEIKVITFYLNDTIFIMIS